MSHATSWAILVLAGLLETSWAVGLKYSDGFTKVLPTLFTLISLTLSIILLAKASQVLPIGTAYGVWVGIGALGASILGVVLFNEPVSPARVLFLSLLLLAIAGLKFTAQ